MAPTYGWNFEDHSFTRYDTVLLHFSLEYYLAKADPFLMILLCSAGKSCLFYLQESTKSFIE